MKSTMLSLQPTNTAHGLALLCRVPATTYESVVKQSHTLRRHPFELPLPPDCQKVLICADIWDTVASVEHMVTLLRWVVAYDFNGAHTQLRIITTNDRLFDGRSVYFELYFDQTAYLVSGSSDDCQGGAKGAHDLWSEFTVVSNSLHIPIHEVDIPRANAAPATEKLHALYRKK